ncbi:MAG: DUF4115 domain-containing protein [Anaerolineales bacterium]|nr:DUF4115 domain-containing protein [Anaerolineales bacterium]
MSAIEVGQQLRQARERRGLDLGEVSQATHIRVQYLAALEAGDLSQLASAAQLRGFLRAYAAYLELDGKALLDLLQPKPEPAAAEESPAMPTPTTPAADGDPSAATFAAIGAELRQQREALQLSVAEVESSTHIPEHQLQRLEKGDFDSFPSPTQARGLLSNYADFLGLEGEGLLLRYAEALQARFAARQASKPRIKRPSFQLPKLVLRLPPWLSTLFSRDLLLGSFLGLTLLVFVAWGIGRVAAAQANQEPEPTAPPLTGLLLNTTEPQSGDEAPAGTPGSINLLGDQATPTPGVLGEATIEVGASGTVSIRLLALQRTWMQVTVDGEIQFEGRTLPGRSYSFNALNQITLVAGNGAAVRAFLNEQDLGLLGNYSAVVHIIFNQQGAATPTVTPTPTTDPAILTATADFLLTPSPTPSPTPTLTPQPTNTVDASGGSP